jgi:Nucleoside diphosphate kinase
MPKLFPFFLTFTFLLFLSLSSTTHSFQFPSLFNPTKQEPLLQKMSSEQTFIAVKPDGVMRGLVGEIIGRFEKRG